MFGELMVDGRGAVCGSAAVCVCTVAMWHKQNGTTGVDCNRSPSSLSRPSIFRCSSPAGVTSRCAARSPSSSLLTGT